MQVSPERRAEMAEFLKTASSEDIVNYLVQYIRLTDTCERLARSDRQRIQELEDAYQINLPQEPVQVATQQLREVFSERVALMNEKDD